MYKHKKLYVILLIALIICVLAPFVGMTGISFEAVIGSPETSTQHDIFWKIRLPRVCLSLLSGAALATGGMVFQGVFRNFLATPFTLGVSSGAAFGAALYYRLGFSFAFIGLEGSSLCAFAGALGTVLFVYTIAFRGYGVSSVSVLLAGVIVSFFFSSLIVFIQYISDFNSIFRITRWLMGGFEVVGFESVWSMLPFVVVGIFCVFFFSRELDLLTLGDELATSRGVAARKVKLALFISTSLMIGGVVSLCGPIGFVGIMVPHVCRLIVGYNHHILTFTVVVVGGAFLTLCDTVARIVIAPYEIPVGVITALLGGPFFLWLLLGSSNRQLRL